MFKTTLAFIAFTLVPAQAPTFFSHTDVVLLRVSVTDRQHRPLTGLMRSDFIVREAGQLQTIGFFSDEDLPVTVGLIVDTSGSMAAKHKDVVTAGLAFATASRADDEFFAVEFNDAVRDMMSPGVLFTNQPAALRRALLEARVGGRTALYDAVAHGLEYLKRGEQDQKALVVVSDGRDNASRLTFPNLADRVAASPAVIYTIGVFEAGNPDANPGVLKRLADLSGGVAFFPKDSIEIRSILERIASDIRTSYTIGYMPANAAGSFRFRDVEVLLTKGHTDATVRHRHGYVPASSKPGAP